MADISGLSKKEIQEEYEDLVFRKVMAIYVQKEGKQILSEIEEEKKNDDIVVDSKAIVKLYDKKETLKEKSQKREIEQATKNLKMY